jgi:hypothetical protein
LFDDENERKETTMKRLAMISMLWAAVLPAYSQVVLNAGDVWTCQFTNLPQVVTGTGQADLLSGFYLNVSSYEVGTDLLVAELFEDSVDGLLVCSVILNTDPWPDSCSEPRAIADFQGAVRITMLSGSATLEDVTFYYQQPTGIDTWTRNELTVVPRRGATLVDQLVPCTGPASGGKWKNHGAYVSAVVDVLMDLLSEEAITEQEAEEIVAVAGKSNCGKK